MPQRKEPISRTRTKDPFSAIPTQRPSRKKAAAKKPIIADRYELEKLIGDGGMGQVFRGTDQRLGRIVAVKTIRNDYLDDRSEQFRELFNRESKFLARLAGHPNILCYFDHGIYRGMPYLVVEYLPNGDLHGSSGKLDPGRLLRVAEGSARALAFAHREELIHRDIKPQNLLWNRDQSGIKISDFGLARSLQESTSPYTAKGWNTPAYAAPEQLRDSETNKKTDLYQLGACLYHVATGQLPIPNPKRGEDYIKQVETYRPIAPNRVKAQVPEGLSACIMQLLEKKPGKRPKDAVDVLNMINDVARVHSATNFRVTKEFLRECKPLKDIREALKGKIERITECLAKTDSPLVPTKQEDPEWYMTILLRPSAVRGKGLANYFHIIYFACFRRQERHAWSDWVRSPHLFDKRLSIDSCCSGLPVRWPREGTRLRKNPLNQEFMTPQIHRTTGAVEWILLQEIQRARFNSDPNEVQEVYANADDVGWELLDKRGQPYVMRQEIETSVIVPIYFEGYGEENLSDRVLGVVNLEWVESLNSRRIEKLTEYLRLHIHGEQRVRGKKGLVERVSPLPISLFSCDVLRSLTHASRQLGFSTTIGPRTASSV